MSVTFDLVVGHRSPPCPHILGTVQFPIMPDMGQVILFFSGLHDGKRSNLAENTDLKVYSQLL